MLCLQDSSSQNSVCEILDRLQTFKYIYSTCSKSNFQRQCFAKQKTHEFYGTKKCKVTLAIIANFEMPSSVYLNLDESNFDMSTSHIGKHIHK